MRADATAFDRQYQWQVCCISSISARMAKGAVFGAPLFFNGTADAAGVQAQRPRMSKDLSNAGEQGSQTGNLLTRVAVGSTPAKSSASWRTCRHRASSVPRSAAQACALRAGSDSSSARE